MTPLGDGRNFDITVRSEDGQFNVYRTLDIISVAGARTLHGRGTRVWKAVLLQEGEASAEHVVLKDAWIDTRQEAEGVKIDMIHKAERNTEFNDFVDSVFLSVKHYGNVFLGDKLDRTRDFVETAARRPPSGSLDKAANTTSDTHLSQKVHYRIVFGEVCYPVYKERSLGRMFTVLGHVAIGVCQFSYAVQ